MSKPAYGRVLLKLSGEALMGDLPYGTDLERVQAIARQIRQLRPQVLDRLAFVSILVEVLLIEQDELGGPLLDLSFDDFLDHVVGLAFLARLLFEDPFLGLALRRRDLFG